MKCDFAESVTSLHSCRFGCTQSSALCVRCYKSSLQSGGLTLTDTGVGPVLGD